MFYGVTPEMIEAMVAEHRKRVAALSPEQRAWLQAESDWKIAVATEVRRRNERQYDDMADLLEEDIRAYGEPAAATPVPTAAV